MNRRDFQELAGIRIAEAKALLDASHFDGAYYLAGYAVECGLKACIARATKSGDFPDRRTVLDSYVHDLQKLVAVAGLAGALDIEMNTSPVFKVNWFIVKDWSAESRYQRWTSHQAADLVSAASGRRYGVIRWLRRHW